MGLAGGDLMGIKVPCGIAVDGGVGYNRAGVVGLDKGALAPQAAAGEE